MSNRLNADPWLNIPHLADDDYVINFAQTVKDNLNSNRKVYIEYSNEIWNGPYYETIYSKLKANELGYGLSDAGLNKFYVKRSLEIFKIFEDVFAGQTNRLVKVIASQAYNPGRSSARLNYISDISINPNNIHIINL